MNHRRHLKIMAPHRIKNIKMFLVLHSEKHNLKVVIFKTIKQTKISDEDQQEEVQADRSRVIGNHGSWVETIARDSKEPKLQ